MNYAMVNDDGAIIGIYSTPLEMIYASADVSDVTHYYDRDTQEIREKVPADVSASVDGLVVTLTGVPVGATISVNGVSDTADAETFEIELEAPGAYQIRVYGVPAYREQSLTVEV